MKLKKIKIIMFLCIFLLICCKAIAIALQYPELPNKVKYIISPVGRNNTIICHGHSHFATYKSKVFDGKKTPLIYLYIFNYRWDSTNDLNTSAWYNHKDCIVFQGLVDFFIRDTE